MIMDKDKNFLYGGNLLEDMEKKGEENILSIENYKDYSEKEWNDSAEGIDSIMEAFAICMKNGNAAESAEGQSLVERLQNYISEHFYNCTTQILEGLGQIYVSDDRFKQNIDAYGSGTAEYINHAITAYCNT